MTCREAESRLPNVGIIRSALLRHPLLAVAIGLAALALRLAVPAGYMPVMNGGGLVLALCSNSGPAAASEASHHSELGSHEDPGAPKADSSCAFADLSLPVIGGAGAVQLAAALLFVIAAGLFFAAPLPPRSALRLRPPLRGPPLPA